MSFFHRIKARIPYAWLQPYHFVLAHAAAFWYRYPARELVVIGVTGTNGKTTTSYLTAKALEASGFATGCTTTAIMKIADHEWINRTKMTMTGRFSIQRLMRQMVKAGCRYVVVETSSQGLKQFRHIGIQYDIGVFTNLTPEHVEAHGGFESYKQAKAILFQAVATSPVKVIGGKAIPKALVLNRSSEYSDFYASHAPGVPVIWFGLDPETANVAPEEPIYQAYATKCKVNGANLTVNLPGKYNLENALAALAVCQALQVDLSSAAKSLSNISGVPGRLERVDLGQPWQVIIDYAYEPEALKKCLEALTFTPHKRLIHVLGGCGGGRDAARRPLMGEFAGKHADIAIITNEDPYDDDPQMIINEVAVGAQKEGKILNKDLFCILDRETAILKAMELAKPGDLVLLTGKGCEPWICVADGQKMAWNERQAAERAIKLAWKQ